MLQLGTANAVACGIQILAQTPHGVGWVGKGPTSGKHDYRQAFHWIEWRCSWFLGARKLKFGTLVGFLSTSAQYKNLSARGRLGRSAAPNLYFGTPSISPELIELAS